MNTHFKLSTLLPTKSGCLILLLLLLLIGGLTLGLIWTVSNVPLGS